MVFWSYLPFAREFAVNKILSFLLLFLTEYCRNDIVDVSFRGYQRDVEKTFQPWI